VSLSSLSRDKEEALVHWRTHENLVTNCEDKKQLKENRPRKRDNIKKVILSN
jgi:hypothetical protein